MAPDVTHVQPRVQSPAGPDDEDDALSLWKAQYPMPEEKGTVSKPQAALKYRYADPAWHFPPVARVFRYSVTTAEYTLLHFIHPMQSISAVCEAVS